MGVGGEWVRAWFGPKEVISLPSLTRTTERSTTSARHQSEFALRLYEELRARAGNLCFSPFSIQTALGMAYAGARGETADQMRRVLASDLSDEQLHANAAKVMGQLNARSDGPNRMTVANSIWSQQGESLDPAFVELIARYYENAAHVVDFCRNAYAVRERINRWVEDQTAQTIRDLIPYGGLNADTRLVLANAMYFAGKWDLPFPKSATCDMPFYLSRGAPRARR